ncbi:Methyltransferase-like protein 17, mitochondrial [Anthophora quadrimaculata]
MSIRQTFMKYKQMRWYSTKQKMKVIDTVNDLLSNNELKHKCHPGKIKPKQVEQPAWLKNTVLKILKDETISPNVIKTHSKNLSLHLHKRHPPLEPMDMKLKFQEIRSRVQIDDAENLSDEELLQYPIVRKLFNSIVYHWTPILYDRYTSIAYLIGRSVPEYSVLYKIFKEIHDNDKSFMPKTLFDFGSGVGTVMWAASQLWHESIKEYYCVDVSGDANELCENLIKYATPKININYVFHRQFMPASVFPTYDIVVSAYSLLELSNQKARIQTLLKLWQKTEKYLIIVEQGTRVGYKIIIEARNFILNYGDKVKNAYVFSPCPHDLKCPRNMTDDTPCNFEISYLTLPIGEASSYKCERYSYVVLKKGDRPENDVKWPRIVRPVLRRSKHVICRMCTNSGNLEEQIFTTWKNGKNTYRCARESEWGDRLPFEYCETTEIEEPEEK